MTMIEELLGGKTGETIAVKPDYLVITDGSGYEVVEDIHAEKLKNYAKGVIVIDHDVPAGNSDSSAIFEKLVHFSKKYEVPFIQAKGAAYAVMLDTFVKPGNIVLSCSAHNSIYGAAGALGLQVDAKTLAKLFTEDNYSFTIPETVRIDLKGRLADASSAIDLWITLLGTIDADKLAGKVIEFTGEGLKNLSKHARVVLCSMATRTGAITALVNESAQEKDDYAQTIVFQLDTVSVSVALPVSKKNSLEEEFAFEKFSALKNQEFDAGFIGGYTGGYIEDLRVAADLMKGKHLDLGFRLNVCPVSSDVYLQALKEGLIETFIDFGAQILAPGDHNIVLQGAGVAGPKEKVLTTGSYNFSGCLGSEDALVYIGSVASVVAAALHKQSASANLE